MLGTSACANSPVGNPVRHVSGKPVNMSNPTTVRSLDTASAMILSVVPVATPNSNARPGPLISPSAKRSVSWRLPIHLCRGQVLKDESRSLFSGSDIERIPDIAACALFQLIHPVIYTIALVHRGDRPTCRAPSVSECMSRSSCCHRASSASTTSATARCSFSLAAALSRSSIQ